MKGFKKIVIAFIALVLWNGLNVCVASAENLVFTKKIVMFQEGVLQEEIQAYAEEWEAYGVSVITELPFINGLVLKVPSDVTSEDLAADPRVLSVEDNQKIHIQGFRHERPSASADGDAKEPSSEYKVVQEVPTPPWYHRPWGVIKLYGQFYDPDLLTDEFNFWAVPKVIKRAWWEMAKKTIRIAILDTGVDSSHPSLRWEIKGGFDVTTMRPGVPFDDNGHGTHIAGTIISVVGTAEFTMEPPAHLYAVKILDRYTCGDIYNLVIGLQWAIEHGMDIVNMSVSYRDDSPAVRKAVQKAHGAGLIMVAAAGNHSNWDDPAPGGAVFVGAADGGAADGGAADGGAADGGAADGGAADGGAADGGAADGGAADGGAADGGAADGGAADGGAADGGAADGGAADGGAADGGAADGGAADGGAADGGAADGGGVEAIPWYSVMYPARYPEVIAVGASTADGEMADFSNAGSELDLTAPGERVVSTAKSRDRRHRGGFGVCSGTSMATPHVTAAVAFMLALKADLDSEEIQRILWETSDGLLDNQTVGDLDLVEALEKVLECRKDNVRERGFWRFWY
jgi:hypothetical protein